MQVYEATIAQMQSALGTGRATSVGLVVACLNRIAAFDRTGPRLNAVPILNPEALAEARASDLRRARGETLGPLDGIPYTAKNSYKVQGLTVAAGSPAFAGLVAGDDAFAVARLRAGGAVLIGLTNMPPMANGGMQRGVYGRAESPYSAEFLTAAFASGSSNGSGTATAAGFAAFGLAEETWSSGRAPAANNALCAYTPSRGVISLRGNWPLVPTMDVMVPHARTMGDMLALLDVIVADDPDTSGDFWRAQDWVQVPAPSAIRPPSYAALAQGASLRGKRIGVPAMYINADPQAGMGATGIGGPTGQRIDTRPSIMALWDAARRAMEDAGATIIVTDFPLVSNYEGDRAGRPTIGTRGLVSPDYLKREILDLSAFAMDDFLRRNADLHLNRLAQVDGLRIFPAPKGSLPDRYTGFDDVLPTYPAHIALNPIRDFRDIPDLADGLRGLEATRKADLEDWMDALHLDAVVFPAVADVGAADADVNPASADHAWRNGVWVANGNLAIRHCGVPTVTVPMGEMADTGMPAGLTFAGRGWDDTALLALACAFEATGPYRAPPPRTPPLAPTPYFPAQSGNPAPQIRVTTAADGPDHLWLELEVEAQAKLTALYLDGREVDPKSRRLRVARNTHQHSEWQAPYGPMILALFADGQAALAT